MARGKTNRRRNVVSYSQYIDGEVQKTRRQVKLTEVSAALVTLFLGMLLFLLAAVVIDHWILPLKAMGRWGMLLALVGGVGAFAFIRLMPLLFRRVNPVYAAKAIEERSPAMNNSLVNHLMLRDNRQGASRGVLRAVEKQAAQNLSKTSVEGAVDRSKLLRLGYLLLGLMLICAFYKFFSPKDPLTTFSRIAAPWTEVAAPTRVQIEQIRPGKDTWVYADAKSVEVEAVVRGLRRDEPVKLYWSTHDGRVENQEIEMQPMGGGSRRFRGYLPEENRNLQQSVSYFIAAGDAQSRVFRVEVRTMPLIAVKRVKYEYPPYTRQPPRTQEGGAIAAVEGTWVTVEAEANQRIQTAVFDAHCDGLRIRPMKVSGKTASIRFQLQAKGALAAGRLNQYLIRFTNDEGHETPAPPRHAFIVRLDPPPAVQIVRPQQRAVKLPINGSLTIQVQATDREYGLWSVALKAELKRQQANVLLMTEPLLGGGGDFPQEFSGSFEFSPRDDRSLRRLQVGDTVEIWAEATDNRHNASGKIDPNPKTRSNRIVVKIIEAVESLRPDSENEDRPPMKRPGDPKDKTGAKNQQNKEDQPNKGKPKKKDDKDGKGKGGAGSNGSGKPKKKGEEIGDSGAGGKSDAQKRQELLRKNLEKQEQQGGGASKEEGNGGQAGSTGNKSKPDGKGSSRTGGPSKGEKGAVDGDSVPMKKSAEGGTKSKQKFPGETKGNKGKDAKEKTPSNLGDPKTKQKGTAAKKKNNQGFKENPDPGGKPNPKAKGDGTSSRGGDEKSKNEKKKKSDSNLDAEGGNPDSPKGGGSGGNKTDDPTGTPKPDSEIEKVNKAKDVKDQPEGEENKAEPDSPGQTERESKRNSPSKKGDRAGGGGRGGGQKAKGKQGTGSGGESTNSESGQGAAKGSGSGVTGTEKGNKKKADSATGNSSGKEGPGAKTTEGTKRTGKGNSPKGAKPKNDAGSESKSGSASGNTVGDSANRKGEGAGLGNQNPKSRDPVETPTSEPDLDALGRAVDLCLKELRDHPDEAGFTTPKQRKDAKQYFKKLRRVIDEAKADGGALGEKLREMIGPLRSKSSKSAGGNIYGIRQSELRKYLDEDIFRKPDQIRPRRN